MIAADTKCIIKKVPGEAVYAHLLNKEVVATSVAGARGTGTQAFKLESQTVFGNGDSGFEVVPK